MKTSFRVYADTSVYGGVFDRGFEIPSRRFFEQVRSGKFDLIISAIVKDEIQDSPLRVRNFFDDLLPFSELVELTQESITLHQAYLKAGIVSPKWEVDALHVALAVVSGCRMIVSWNFKHIVHFQKIPMYNGINMARGFSPVGIYSPQEVIADEDEQDL